MQLSKIGSKNTYHKCIKQLHEAKYIYYHPALSRFQVVRISIARLDQEPEQGNKYQQLDLFSGTNNDTGTVPDLRRSSTNFDTSTVSKMGHSYKPNNKKQNSVSDTPTKIFETNDELNEKINNLAGVPKLRHGAPEQIAGPALVHVENFFRKNKYSLKEARKFFYYNQGKNWMLTEKLAITDWKALALKWMINTKEKEEEVMDIDISIQYLYERFLEGERINKLLLPEFADHLQLEITAAIKQEALQRRLNQLSGSNENSNIKLWQAYMNEQWQNEIVINDETNLTALAKRLAVLKHFQKFKSIGETTITND